MPIGKRFVTDPLSCLPLSCYPYEEDFPTSFYTSFRNSIPYRSYYSISLGTSLSVTAMEGCMEDICRLKSV